MGGPIGSYCGMEIQRTLNGAVLAARNSSVPLMLGRSWREVHPEQYFFSGRRVAWTALRRLWLHKAPCLPVQNSCIIVPVRWLAEACFWICRHKLEQALCWHRDITVVDRNKLWANLLAYHIFFSCSLILITFSNYTFFRIIIFHFKFNRLNYQSDFWFDLFAAILSW